VVYVGAAAVGGAGNACRVFSIISIVSRASAARENDFERNYWRFLWRRKAGRLGKCRGSDGKWAGGVFSIPYLETIGNNDCAAAGRHCHQGETILAPKPGMSAADWMGRAVMRTLCDTLLRVRKLQKNGRESWACGLWRQSRPVLACAAGSNFSLGVGEGGAFLGNERQQ
jgi:hypothetical protein